MRTEDYSILNIEIRNDIAYATFHGDDEMHRYQTLALYKELAQLASDLAASKEIRALVFTGTDDVLSFGSAPTNAGSYGDSLGPDLAKNTGRLYISRFLDLDMPVITALNGPVRAGMLSFVLLSDIIVAEEHATIRDVHVLVGSPSSTGPFLWPLSVGLMKAKRYVLTGDPLTAEEAERIGLVTEVVGKGESLARATEYAQKLSALSPTAVGPTKRALNQWLKLAFPGVFDSALMSQFLALTMPAFSHEGLDSIQDREFEEFRKGATA